MEINIMTAITIAVSSSAITGIILKGLITVSINKLSQNWKSTADSSLEVLKSELNKNNSTLNSLVTLYGSSYNLAQEKRIESIEILWRNIQEYKNIIPSGTSFIFNILTKREIDDIFDGKASDEGMLSRLSGTDLIAEFESKEKFLNEIRKTRPFLSDEIWTRFEVLQIFIGRVTHLSVNGVNNRTLKHWHNDLAIKDMLQKTLSKDEFDYIYSLEMSTLKLTQSFLEDKLLFEINKTLSGEHISDTALEKAKKMERVIKDSKLDN